MKNVITLLIASIMVFTVSCSQSNTDAVKVSVVGSTTVQPVAQEVADEFKEVEPNVLVEIQGVGSSAGIKAVIDGTADIGTSSRELTEEEKSHGLNEIVFAKDGIAIIVNNENSLEKLTLEQVKDIFEGKINNWSQLGGVDHSITVIVREDGSGTRDAFNSIVNIDDYVETALVYDSNGSIKSNVDTKEFSIGYVSVAILDDAVKTLPIDDVYPTDETVKDGTYKIQRDLLMLTNDNVSEPAKSYLDYLLSDEGQEIVSSEYISIK